ncbi:hypothetical protein EVAR_89164_1 [Eumeta japonica]|uniref:Uncharacterized protein n=1 Tax=Eumeta variegata TaxID=151549 RepID=A0A4C1Z365_EUMVA|nr:hypothetical protein EVAR_89164_1 [Eumeta japonica]
MWRSVTSVDRRPEQSQLNPIHECPVSRPVRPLRKPAVTQPRPGLANRDLQLPFQFPRAVGAQLTHARVIESADGRARVSEPRPHTAPPAVRGSRPTIVTVQERVDLTLSSLHSS